VVVLIIGIIYFMKGKSSDADKSGNSKDIMSETSDPTKGEGQIGDGTSISDEGADGSKVGVTPEFLLEQYREWSQYPPNSRPLSNYNYDLIEPFLFRNLQS